MYVYRLMYTRQILEDKESEIMIFERKWVVLDNIMLSKVIHIKKNKLLYISHIQILAFHVKVYAYR